MSLPSTLPYVGSRTANLSLSDPRCNSDACKAFYEAHQLSQATVSYNHQYDYGHYSTWYYIVVIGLFTVAFWVRHIQERRHRASHGSTKPTSHIRSKAVAAWRLIAYRRVPGWLSDRFGLPSIGLLIFFLLSILYLILLTFLVRPYYRQHRGYGSPPLGVRTGLMAVALTPLIVALSGKANIVTLLTGIGHEKLNIVHRWVAWMAFALSIVHTVPFIVAPLHDGGYAALHKQFYKPGGLEYTGTPALAILFGIVLLSLPWIRHRAYETFYHLHFWLGVTYVGLMFWHAANEGDSWRYLWATVAAWLISILARAFWFTRPTNVMVSPWGVGAPVTARALPVNMTRLDVVAPEGFAWRPGQHVYLRIPQIGIFDNHPFTIGSDMHTEDFTDEFDYAKVSILSLYIESHAGFTQRLHKHLRSMPDTALEGWLEGPYGGHAHDLGIHYNNVLLVAGGTGVSACLPWLENLVRRMRSNVWLRTTHVRLVWSVRQISAVEWIGDAFKKLDLGSLKSNVEIVVHVTREDVSDRAGKKVKEVEILSGENITTQEDGLGMRDAGFTLRQGRMNVAQLSNGLSQGRTVVVGCGPASLKVDLSNACAAEQKKVLRGQVKEYCLLTETYGW